MPDISGTSDPLRFGPAAGLMLRIYCYAVESLPRSPMERETGFGPATFALARQRSTTEPLPRECSITISNYSDFGNSFFKKSYSADKI